MHTLFVILELPTPTHGLPVHSQFVSPQLVIAQLPKLFMSLLYPVSQLPWQFGTAVNCSAVYTYNYAANMTLQLGLQKQIQVLRNDIVYLKYTEMIKTFPDLD